MIRFCDKEVDIRDYYSLSRSSMLMYFLNGHRDGIVCVFRDGLYYGKITYASLLKNKDDVYDAIDTYYVVLNDNIWQTSMEYFRGYEASFEEIPLLPICDEEGQLLYFAYEDEEANRQIRQLRELAELLNHIGGVQFTDIYDGITNVVIHGFNELAYKFRGYLIELGVSVQVTGDMWQMLGIESDEAGLDYCTMTINAEGTWQKSSNLTKELTRTVGVCFECIDKIYEENIRLGIVKNAEFTEDEFISHLKTGQVIIIDTSPYSVSGMDYLLQHGIKAAAILSETDGKETRFIFGVPVYTYKTIMEKYDNPIFIDCTEEDGAWGTSDGYNGCDVDLFDYHSYRRNRNYFVLNDYKEKEIKWSKALICSQQRIVLVGDFLMCSYFASCVRVQLKDNVTFAYWDILQGTQKEYLADTDMELSEAKEDEFCMVIPNKLSNRGADRDIQKRLEQSYIQALRANNRFNYSEAFKSEFLWDELDICSSIRKENLRIKGIILGAVEDHSGNVFVRGVMDSHPNILMMNYNYLNDMMYYICVRLSQLKASCIVEGLNDIFKNTEGTSQEKGLYGDFKDWKQFCSYLEDYLSGFEYVTSQELFVIFHLAYAKVWDMKIDVENIYIYWEPHHFNRELFGQLGVWLGDAADNMTIIRVIRNHITRNGSNIKQLDKGSEGFSKYRNRVYGYVFSCKNIWDNNAETIIRFEDLKQNPKEVLGNLCEKIGLPWSDTFLSTTSHGEQSSYMGITGFDLKPVYNTYEEYFSAFDRFRISLICYEWQKTYGYPYTSILDFTREELQEMFLKEPRVMALVDRLSEEEEIYRNHKDQHWIRRQLQRLWKYELLEKWEA